jgi:HPt (histidine-containing phosphotransfer) domain-containing protein
METIQIVSKVMKTNESGESNQKVTNLDYLVKLSKGNEQFVKEMIRIFLEENPGEIRMLEQAIEAKDFTMINAAAHKLRSTVPFVGIDKVIADEISELEQLALDQSGNSITGEKAKPARFLPTDRELLQQINILFGRIKNICTRARDELKFYT